MLEKMLKYLVAGLALGCSPVDSERLGCISDDDCKGDRECVQGECVTQEKDAYVGVEEVASCSLDKYVCIDDKTVGELDTCGLTSLYSKCLDSEICSSGECVDKPCPEFNGSEFYEGFDGPLDPCKWEYSEGNKGDVIDGYWVSGGNGLIESKYDLGCEDFTLEIKGNLLNVLDGWIGFGNLNLGLTLQKSSEGSGWSKITMYCPELAWGRIIDGVLDLSSEHLYKIVKKNNGVKTYVDGILFEEIFEDKFLIVYYGSNAGDKVYPPWICEGPFSDSLHLGGDGVVFDYIKLKCD